MSASSWIWIGVLLGLVVYDVLVAVGLIHEPTLSMVVRDYVSHHPYLLLALGYLLEHLTWFQYARP